MAIKVVTGAPGAGKSYYVLREVICKRFDWDEDFHEWKRKNDDKFTIITNLAGLRLPHVNLAQHLRENNIDYRNFFTVSYIRSLTEKIGPVVVILDEAQKFFPRDFKDSKDITDPDHSCFFLFEYHRHLQIDIYLIGQRWTRMSPDIVGLCEYQIDAVRRSFRLGNEFRYNFLNGMERIGGTILRADPKIFALYQSFEGDSEVKGRSINPVRRFALISILGLILLLIALKMFYSSFASPGQASEPTRATAAGAGEAGQITKTLQEVMAKSSPNNVSVAGPGRGRLVLEDLASTQVRLGGMWVGSKLVAVDLFGKVISVRDFPFPFTHDQQAGAVYAMLPDDYLSQIKRDYFLPGGGLVSKGERVGDLRGSVNKEDPESYFVRRQQSAAIGKVKAD